MAFDYKGYVESFGGEISGVFNKHIIVKYDGFEFKLFKNKVMHDSVVPTVSNCLTKTEYFRHIVRSNKHPNLSFDKYIFGGMKSKSIVTCLEHGDFEADAYRLIYLKSGCRKCYDKYHKINVKRKTLEEFVCQSKERFPDKFDYSLTEYKNTMTHVKLVCDIHGVFEQTPNEHLQSVTGCTKCGRELSSGYSLTDYVNVCGNEGSHLYIHKLNDSDSEFIKIGISKNPEKRIKQLKRCGLEFITGWSFYFKDAGLAWCIEKDLHRMYKQHKHIPNNKFEGYTECFDSYIMDDVVDHMNGFIREVRFD